MSDLLTELTKLADSHQIAVIEHAQFVMRIKSFLDQPSAGAVDGHGIVTRGSPPKVVVHGATGGTAGLAKDIAAYLDELEQVRTLYDALRAGHSGVLFRMAVMSRVALFDAFLPDVTAAMLTHDPATLESEKQLTYKEFKEHTATGTIETVIAAKIARGVGYKPIKAQFAWLAKQLSVKRIIEASDLEHINEIVARRNLFAHANGVVNDTYLDLVPDSPHAQGTQLSADFDYWYRANKVLLDTCRHLSNSIAKKFCPNATSVSFFLSPFLSSP